MTLLLCNAASMEVLGYSVKLCSKYVFLCDKRAENEQCLVFLQALPIYLDKLFNQYVAIILSVTFVLAFGEVLILVFIQSSIYSVTCLCICFNVLAIYIHIHIFS